MPMNIRILYPLLRPTAHAIRWYPLTVGAALGLAIVLIPEALTTKLSDANLVDLIRISAACTALGAAFLLDDPATRSTPTVPTPRLARNLVRVAVAAPAIALWWGALLTLAQAMTDRPHATHLPAAALTLEAATLATTALALAAAARRHTADGNTGVIAAPTLVVLAAATRFLPRKVALTTTPRGPPLGGIPLPLGGPPHRCHRRLPLDQPRTHPALRGARIDHAALVDALGHGCGPSVGLQAIIDRQCGPGGTVTLGEPLPGVGAEYPVWAGQVACSYSWRKSVEAVPSVDVEVRDRVGVGDRCGRCL
jgi:hypothetical protein